ncbi:ABC transporter permease [Tabrizicola oligotrophica]|uniref:ABC transporter permease n=1 Tax=Tabrizicola oligotrophica TaxID=2710650 RepID=A0A6M0QZ40_9RHOB|nr:ABC transporter permease [Tabrizicola oligotrophica]NEY92084.1 ABC transporter permease [Tabrizicola oligotrophica]
MTETSAINLPARDRPRLKKGTIELAIGVLIVGAWILAAAGAGIVAPADPNALDLAAVLAPPGPAHLMGTDNLGRDILSRVIHGARIDIWMGFIGVLAPLCIGVLVGLVSGYYGGMTDTILMRLVDITVAFPFFILVIAIVGLLGPGLANYFVALGLVAWVAYARLVRAEVLVVKRLEFVQAAKALGFPDRAILFRHVLPNVLGSITIYAWTDAVMVILAGASLGFLGLGAQPPTAEWGVMISDGQPYIVQAWWICFFPGLAMVTLSLGFILISDGLSRRLRVSQ